MMKRLTSLVAVAGLAAIGIAAAPQEANAWWRGGVWVPPVVVAAPPPVYYPPPVAYVPPPRYHYPPPRRVWVPPHWEGPYWVRGHWA
jgi:hypothetical protein